MNTQLIEQYTTAPAGDKVTSLQTTQSECWIDTTTTTAHTILYAMRSPKCVPHTDVPTELLPGFLLPVLYAFGFTFLLCHDPSYVVPGAEEARLLI
jgi:hypothetical protein